MLQKVQVVNDGTLDFRTVLEENPFQVTVTHFSPEKDFN